MVWYILVPDRVGRAAVGKYDVSKTIHVIMCQEYHMDIIDMLPASCSLLNVAERSTSVIKDFCSSSQNT
jgi:hypothetical protein